MKNLLIDLLKANRHQRHDMLNHLQVIWGYLQLNKSEQAIEYIKIITDYLKSLRVINNINSPELAADLSIKLLDLGLNDPFTLEVPKLWEVKEDKIFEVKGFFDESWDFLFPKIQTKELNIKFSLLEGKIIIYVHNIKENNTKILETIKNIGKKYNFNCIVSDEHIIIKLN